MIAALTVPSNVGAQNMLSSHRNFAAAPAALFTVLNTDDSGVGSLRQAITDANSSAGADEIQFNITPKDGTVKTVRTVLTNGFGYYRFEAISIDETYILEARAKRYKFSPQVVSITEEISNLDFSANL